MATDDFTIHIDDAILLGDVLAAAQATARVVVYRDGDDPVEGTARAVTRDDRGAFATMLTPDTFLRVTTTQGFEAFIPLRGIERVERR